MSWSQRIGIGLSALATLFFLADAAGKLFQAEPVLKASREIGWPPTTVIPIGVVLLLGALLYAVPKTAFVGAIYLTGFLGATVAAHYRIGSPLATHILFGIYVAAIMWSGLALRYPEVFKALWNHQG
jgi:hypothetical protein